LTFKLINNIPHIGNNCGICGHTFIHSKEKIVLNNNGKYLLVCKSNGCFEKACSKGYSIA
jgi:hypothetical protein